jgi:hypothetical protein
MEAETQTEEEQVNIIEPSDPITPMDIGNFASGTDSMEIVMFFFMYRNIAFWIKFICKHHWFEKDLENH